MEPFIGQIMMFGGNFAPRGWAFCDGQLLPISQNTALFSLLGTTYGGDGRTTFALPDLRGRTPIHSGHGPGLSDYRQGSKGGQETVTLTVNQMPSHNHVVKANLDEGTSDEVENNYLSNSSTPLYSSSADGNLNTSSVVHTGGGQAHSNMQPYLAIQYVIALQGIFPSRS